MTFYRFFRRVLPFFAICSCLAAAPATPGGEEGTPNPSSSWLHTLWDLPVVSRFASLLQMPSTCRVAPLPELADAEALEFESGLAPDTAGLMPAMARALENFRKLVRSAGGTFELKSAYRPPIYQAHLQAVWFKWMLELRNNREPGCQALRAEVADEFKRHDLMETQKPVTSSDHTRGLAFDATVIMPRIAKLKKRRVSLDRLAMLAGITRPDIRHDPVHFRLAIVSAIRRA